jgi:hypothetical protein
LRTAATKAHNAANVSHATCPPPTGYVPCEQYAALRAVRCDGVVSDARLLARSFAQVVVHVPVVFRASGIALLFLFCESLSPAQPTSLSQCTCTGGRASEKCASWHPSIRARACQCVLVCTHADVLAGWLHTYARVSASQMCRTHNSAASSCQQCSTFPHLVNSAAASPKC